MHETPSNEPKRRQTMSWLWHTLALVAVVAVAIVVFVLLVVHD